MQNNNSWFKSLSRRPQASALPVQQQAQGEQAIAAFRAALEQLALFFKVEYIPRGRPVTGPPRLHSVAQSCFRHAQQPKNKQSKGKSTLFINVLCLA